MIDGWFATYEWDLVGPLIEPRLEASGASLSDELADDEHQVDRRRQDTTQSQWANLGRVGRGNDDVESVGQATEDLSGAEHSDRGGEELQEHEYNRVHTAGTEGLLSAVHLHEPTARQRTEDLPDGVAHAQAQLPWCRDLICAVVLEVSVFVLEGRERIERGDDLRIETSHDDGNTEEVRPERGRWVLLHGIPELQLVLDGGDLSRRIDLKVVIFLEVGLILSVRARGMELRHGDGTVVLGLCGGGSVRLGESSVNNFGGPPSFYTRSGGGGGGDSYSS